MKTEFNTRRTGLTIVELLVVIAIMGVLTVLIVPQVRLINKDRNIREAARVVGAALTQARDRAIATGAAGLQIERNKNIVDSYGSYYAGTRLYLMRKVPNYQGESANVSDISAGSFVVSIPKPYRWDQEKIIQIGDRIRLNHGSIRYPITGFGGGVNLPNRVNLQVGLSGFLPSPAAGGNDLSFVVERQPRRIESSRVDLPDGYIIDLRYSGYWDANFEDTNESLGETTEFARQSDDLPIQLMFGPDGSMDRLSVGSLNGQLPYIPSIGAMELFVTEYDVERATAAGLPAAVAALANPASLWVAMTQQSGGVNVGYNKPPTDADRALNPYNTPNDAEKTGWEIYCARGLSRNRTSANQ